MTALLADAPSAVMSGRDVQYSVQAPSTPGDVAFTGQYYVRQEPEVKCVYVAGVERRWLRPTIDALTHILALGPNWDSYGARQIDEQEAVAALMLLDRHMREHTPAPIVVPTVRGGVQMEWHSNGVELEIETLSPTAFLLFFVDPRAGIEWEGEVGQGATRIDQYLARLS